ncbi:hypothetical protein EDB89DRAFT_2241552 [Lactarius sanguifluus]|nr:hypothetical protein EDB89DRAFT_2241552 [Lactarius sanguifluus]
MIAQRRRKKQKNVRARGKSYRHDTTISMLPDNVLLQIFDFCRRSSRFFDDLDKVWKWNFLVHVCQRWRQVIFGSQHRLNLRISCTPGTPVRKNIGIWPAFPIIVRYVEWGRSVLPNDEDNVVAALEHPDRVSYLWLIVTGSQLEKMAMVMQEPFPVLESLYIRSGGGNAPVLPAKFLGGSAPRLQYIDLYGIPFPTLPTLLLSAGDLVSLRLFNIPPTGYIIPKAMVACLAVLPRLESMVVGFQSAISRPNRISPPPATRTVLPSLTSFEFQGASEYLEDLAAQIDSPQLDRIKINYFNQVVDFQVAQLSEFIGRSVGPKLALLRHAQVAFSRSRVFFEMGSRELHTISGRGPVLTSVLCILCQGIDWQVSHIAQVLSHVSVALSNVVHLELADFRPEALESTDDVEWRHLLHQFSTVQTLHVYPELAGHVALALEEITGEMTTDVLQSLDLLYLVGQPTSSVDKFVTARQLSGRPLTVVDTKTEFNRRLKSCHQIGECSTTDDYKFNSRPVVIGLHQSPVDRKRQHGAPRFYTRMSSKRKQEIYSRPGSGEGDPSLCTGVPST